jgi:hypothetical protein
VAIPEPPEPARPAFVRFPVRVRDRAAALRAAGRFAVLGEWLSEPIDGAVGPGAGDYAAGSCPRAEHVVRHLVALPTHLKVRECDVEGIVSAIRGDV